jgi:hypothetical protein
MSPPHVVPGGEAAGLLHERVGDVGAVFVSPFLFFSFSLYTSGSFDRFVVLTRDGRPCLDPPPSPHQPTNL